MTKTRLNPRSNPSPAVPLELPAFPDKNLLLLTWSLLAIVALWRFFLSLHVLLQPSLATGMGAAVINWRRLDQFTAWIALLLLFLGSPPTTAGAGELRRRRITLLLSSLFTAGIFLTALSILWDEFSLPDALTTPVAWTADILLAIAALAIAGKQLATLFRALRPAASSNIPPGLTLLDLWRFAAAQWALYMVASMLSLRVSLPKNGLLENEQIRSLLFQLPAVAVLPQAMMIAGIAWWSDITRAAQLRDDAPPAPPRPRLRAWVLALLAINVAALLILLRQQWLGIPGSVIGLFAIAMYLVGFPAQTWRTPGGKTFLLAWALLGFAWIFLLLERTLVLSNQGVSTAYYGGAWRHLWSTGAVNLWLFAMATLAANRLLLPHQPPLRPIFVAIVLMIAGTLITSTLLFLASLQQGESQVPYLRALPIGTLPEIAALVIAGATFLRTMKVASASRR